MLQNNLDNRRIDTFVLAAGRPNSNFRFLRMVFMRPPVDLRLCHLSLEIPANRHHPVIKHLYIIYTQITEILKEDSANPTSNYSGYPAAPSTMYQMEL